MIAGLETEYGIMVENRPGTDPTEASQLFFSLWRPERLANWDFASEQPSQDARGWLDLKTPLVPPEAAEVPLPPAVPAEHGADADITFLDRQNFNAMLANGARFYIDHAHPEYSTPECASLRSLMAADVAGQVFLDGVARQASAALPAGQRFVLYRNNTDFHGASYGCHENYLMSAAAYTSLFGNGQHRLFTFLIPYLVTRQIFCGAGKAGAESGTPVDFQISQRADFVETAVGLQTLYRRPIVNTRDEPHADPQKYRRLHVIVGDANMAEPAQYLKIGVTRLVLDMLEAGWGRFRMVLADPVAAIKAVSRDLTCGRAVIGLEGRRRCVSALAVQERYLDEARKFLDACGATDEQEAVWSEWERVLAGLAGDRQPLTRRIDWLIKRQLLESHIAQRGLHWDSPVVKELDIKYHAIAPDRSVYHLLRRNGCVDRLVSDAEVSELLTQPPRDTRAGLRGHLMQSLGPFVLAVNWDCLLVYNPRDKQLARFYLPDPHDDGAAFVEKLATVGDPWQTAMQCWPCETIALEKKNGP